MGLIRQFLEWRVQKLESRIEVLVEENQNLSLAFLTVEEADKSWFLRLRSLWLRGLQACCHAYVRALSMTSCVIFALLLATSAGAMAQTTNGWSMIMTPEVATNQCSPYFMAFYPPAVFKETMIGFLVQEPGREASFFVPATKIKKDEHGTDTPVVVEIIYRGEPLTVGNIPKMGFVDADVESVTIKLSKEALGATTCLSQPSTSQKEIAIK